jgi:hypothetical protein
MALNYPGFVVPQPTNTKLTDVLDQWNAGEAKGKDQRFQDDAPDQFAKALPPLAQYGLTTPPDELRAMFANPNTRALALSQVQEATQRRADAMDPMKQLALKKAQYDVGHLGQVDPTSDMRNFQFAQDNPGFAEFMTGKGSAAANAPAEVQTYLFYRDQATAAGEKPVSFLDFKTALKEKPQGSPSPTIAKEIFEADEGAQAGESVIGALDSALTLNKTAWDGPAADFGTQAGALFGDANSVDTQQLKNLVTAQALDQLKATFGGMPTEGERKILLDIQGSVTQPREVRERIFDRAKKAAERRIQFNKEKASGLRSGEYFDTGYSPVTPMAPADDDVDAILKGYGL